MTHAHSQTITVDDDRYPGRIAEVLAVDCAFTTVARTTTLLLRSTSGEFVVHLHTAPTGNDRIEAIDCLTAQLLYRQMQIHVAPYERLDSSPA